MTEIQSLSKQASKQASKQDVCHLGNLYGEDCGTGFAGNVWDKNGICPTLTTIQGGGRQPHIIEVKELKTKEIGFLEKGTEKHQSNVVYDKNGVCPTICAGMGVKQQPTMIIEEQQIVAMRGRDADCLTPKRTEYGKEIRKAYENHEISEKRENIQQLEPRNDGLCNTITTVQKDNLIMEKVRIVEECGYGDFLYEIEDKLYLIRIRKLTPKECWRLMSFSDEDYEKAESVNSQTQLYKEAGNSIVCNVLVGIMGMFFEGKEDLYKSYIMKNADDLF